MEIRPYRGSDEAELLAVWRASMFADALGAHLFRTKVLLDPNFLPENLPVASQSRTCSSGQRLRGDSQRPTKGEGYGK